MKTMQISINGRKVCTSGIGNNGVLSTHVNWIDPPEHAQEKRSGFGITVGGMVRDEKDGKKFLEWINRELELGDEIIIRLTENDAADAPANIVYKK